MQKVRYASFAKLDYPSIGPELSSWKLSARRDSLVCLFHESFGDIEALRYPSLSFNTINLFISNREDVSH